MGWYGGADSKDVVNVCAVGGAIGGGNRYGVGKGGWEPGVEVVYAWEGHG